jgi:hypothetical protein
MATIIHERDFILIKNMLSSDDRLKLILLKEKDFCAHITCNTYTQLYHNKPDLTDILTDIYTKFIAIIKTEGNKYQQKICEDIVKSFDTKPFNIDSFFLSFKKKFDSKALGYHRDIWSSWNMVVSMGGPATIGFVKSQYIIEDGDVYIFNGDHKRHAVWLSRDEYLEHLSDVKLKICGVDEYRKCYQLRCKLPDSNIVFNTLVAFREKHRKKRSREE